MFQEDKEENNFAEVKENQASQMALVVKNLSAKEGDLRDTGSNLGLGRSPGGGQANLIQDSCLENPMDRGAWQATVYGVTELDMTEQLSTQKPFQIFKNLFLIGG